MEEPEDPNDSNLNKLFVFMARLSRETVALAGELHATSDQEARNELAQRIFDFLNRYADEMEREPDVFHPRVMPLATEFRTNAAALRQAILSGELRASPHAPPRRTCDIAT